MLETLKIKLIETFVLWSAKIDESTDKSYEVNMVSEFSDILARNIIQISFGEDLSDEKIEI